MKIRNLIVVAVLGAGSAFAQNQVVKPNGIKIGEGRLHPFLTVRAAYDSAAGLFPTGQVDAMGNAIYGVRGDVVLTPSAGVAFNLDTGNTMVNFNGGAGFTWYTGLVTPGSTQLSFFGANVGLDTAFNRQGAVEFQIGDTFSRSNRSANLAAGVGIISLYNSARAAAPIHPGGGAIVITPSVRWDVEFFSPQVQAARTPDCMVGDIRCDPDVLNRMNYNNLYFGLNGKWKFLPKTAVVADVGFDWRNYFNTSAPNIDPATGRPLPVATTNLNAQLLRATVGVTGLITSRISALALVGAGYDFAGTRNGTFIAQAELAYLGQDFTVRGGYLRTLAPVPIYGNLGQDRGYLEGRLTLFGRLTMRAFGSFDYISYAQVARRDYLVTGVAEVSYQFVSFFSAALSYTLTYRKPVNLESGASTVDYIRHEPALVLTLMY